ncbi:hypothetical protein ACJJTC_011658 [Scirpophaga incertulas]
MPKRKNKNTDEYILKKLKKLEKKLKKRSRKNLVLRILKWNCSLKKVNWRSQQRHPLLPILILSRSLRYPQLTNSLQLEMREKKMWNLKVSLDEDILALLEIKAALSEALQKKDKAIEQKQSQQAAAISCIGQALTKIFNNKGNKDNEVIKLLIDAGGLLCDSQYVESMSRRSFVTSSIKKEVKDQIYLTEIDNYLFGEKLSETLKTAKAINKSSADIKTVQSKSSNLPQPKRNLNLRPPFPPERQMGTGNKSAHFHRRHQVGVYLPPHPTTSSQIPQRPLQPPQRSRGKPQQRR